MTRKRAFRNAGWVPQQHGAWFMLALPFLVGVLLRPSLAWYLAPLFGCWLTGYLAFNAASVWLKSPPTRRAPLRRPLAVYAAATAALGLITLLGAPAGLWLWLLGYVPLLGPALWLAAQRKERVLAGGLLTVAAASLMTLVSRFPDPAELLGNWGEPAARQALIATGLVFGYLFGTVFYVKTMIRQRGDSGWLAASIGWHGLLTAGAAALAVTGQLSWAWTAFFAATVVRSAVLPWLAGSGPVRPGTVGMIEIGFTAAFVLLAVLAL